MLLVKSLTILDIFVFILIVYVVDFLSGCVHVVLDNTKFLTSEHILHATKGTLAENLNLSFFKKLCYDFQLHHAKPNTISTFYLYQDAVLGITIKLFF